MRRRVNQNQTGWFNTPRVDQLPVSVANDEEEKAPQVRVKDLNQEYVNVTENKIGTRAFTVSLHRKNGAADFSLSFTTSQMKHIVLQGSKLLGVVALDLDELDDCFDEVTEDCDEE